MTIKCTHFLFDTEGDFIVLHICHVEKCEISPHSTSVMYINLKFHHMTDFSGACDKYQVYQAALERLIIDRFRAIGPKWVGSLITTKYGWQK